MKYVTEKEVLDSLSMPEVIDGLKFAFIEHSAGRATFSSRNRIVSGGVMLNTMPAILDKRHIAGLKTYMVNRKGARFVVLVFDTENNELKGIVEANRLGQMRTGALPALATSLIIGRKAINFSLFGTGYQAETQLEAMKTLFELKNTKVYSRNPDHIREFVKRFSDKFSIDIQGASSPTDCLEGSDVINTVTDSKEPLFEASDLGESYHINLVGGNLPNRREIGSDILSNADAVIVEDLKQALIESGEIIDYYNTGKDKISEFSELIVDPKRFSGMKRTVFKTMGVGLEDIITADILLEKLS